MKNRTLLHFACSCIAAVCLHLHCCIALALAATDLAAVALHLLCCMLLALAATDLAAVSFPIAYPDL